MSKKKRSHLGAGNSPLYAYSDFYDEPHPEDDDLTHGMSEHLWSRSEESPSLEEDAPLGTARIHSGFPSGDPWDDRDFSESREIRRSAPHTPEDSAEDISRQFVLSECISTNEPVHKDHENSVVHDVFKQGTEWGPDELNAIPSNGQGRRPSETVLEKNPRGGYQPGSLANRVAGIVMGLHHIVTNEKGEVFVFDKTHYRRMTSHLLHVLIRSCVPPDLEAELSKQKTNEVEYLLRTRPANLVMSCDFVAPEAMINFQNLVYDCETGVLKKHSPQYYFQSVLKASYKETALSGALFTSLVNHICGHELETIMMLQEFAGYMLHNSNTAKKALFLEGPASSGKSVFCEIMASLIGHSHVSQIRLHALEDRFSSGALARVHANICSEVDPMPIRRLATFNQLISNETVHAEDKGKDLFSFQSRVKLLFAMNRIPTVQYDEMADAFYDRLLIIQVPSSIPEADRDPDLLKKILDDEIDYVARWAIIGLKRLIQNNFKFTQPERMKALIRSLKSQRNSAKEFLLDCVDVTHKPTDRCFVSDLYEQYALYCKANTLETMKSHDFKRELDKQGLVHKKIRAVGKPSTTPPRSGYTGLKLRCGL